MATYRKINDISQFEPKKPNTKALIICAIAAVLTVALVLGALLILKPEVFRGKKTITIEIHHSDEMVETFEIKTQKLYLGEVLVDEDLVETADGPYGLYITAAGRVGKEVAIYEQNGAYWAVYEGDVYAEKGISELPIQDGVTYKLIFTRG